MYDPCFPEAYQMFERMTGKHARELLESHLVWEKVEHDGDLMQIVPVLLLRFKTAFV